MSLKMHGLRLRPSLLACLLIVARTQDMTGGAPSTNSLLNDLRSMKFPSASPGQVPQQGAGSFGGLGQMGGGLGGLGAQLPGQMGGQLGGQMGQTGGQMGLGGLPGGQMGTAGMAGTGGQMGLGGLGGLGGMGGMGSPLGTGAQTNSQMGMGGQMGAGAQMPGQMGMAGLAGSASPNPPAQQLVQVDESMLAEFGCKGGLTSQSWSAAKDQFQQVFRTTPPWQPIQRETLVSAMEAGMARLTASSALAPSAAEDCGFGKLAIQLFSFATIDNADVLPALFSSYEPLASPVLTMMLDVPWAALATAGWPFFGLLAQIGLRKAQLAAVNDDALDGFDDPAARQFHAELIAALSSKDGLAAQRAATTYLAAGPKGESALPPLTALAAQAMASPEPQERLQLLEVLQNAFKQVIGSGQELDVALSTKWPLWGLVHVALDAFS